jgi:putative membrane protein
VLGTALSILLAVRANTSYQRWWEGSAIWAQIVGLSRNLVRVVVSVSNSKTAVDPAAVRAFQRDVAQRQIAYVIALRAQLRGHHDNELADPLARLRQAEHDLVTAADNKALTLLAGQSARIFAAYGDGLLTGLDNFQMETALAALSTQQALAERISMQPVPRTYDVFSRYLVHLYTVIFPFAVISTLPEHRWLVIPATLIVAFAFRIVERIGSVVEAPFGNTTQDVPLTAIGDQLARDLLFLVGDSDRPPAPRARHGYLW